MPGSSPTSTRVRRHCARLSRVAYVPTSRDSPISTRRRFGLAQLGSDIQRKGLLAYPSRTRRHDPVHAGAALRRPQVGGEDRAGPPDASDRQEDIRASPWEARPRPAWEKHRFSTPYLRDQLMTEGVIVETMETAAPWSRIEYLHDTIKQDIEKSLADARHAGPGAVPHFAPLHLRLLALLHRLRSAAGGPGDGAVEGVEDRGQ